MDGGHCHNEHPQPFDTLWGRQLHYYFANSLFSLEEKGIPPIENKSQYQSCGKMLDASFSTLKLVNLCVIYIF
jgi:hypothetical protein